jgi:hypothetical protein
VGKLPDGDLEAWDRAGRLLRGLDEERFQRILRVSKRIVDAHIGSLAPNVMAVDVDSSTDLS